MGIAHPSSFLLNDLAGKETFGYVHRVTFDSPWIYNGLYKVISKIPQADKQ